MSTVLAGADLTRRSFKNQDLPGAVLRSADLRGADFSGANLHGADLSEVRTGMHGRWAAAIVIAALAASILIGALAGCAGAYLRELMTGEDARRRALGVLIGAELAVLLVVIAWRGVDAAVRHVLPVIGALAVVAGTIAIAMRIGTGRVAVAMIVFALLIAAIVFLGSFARAVAGTAGDLFFVVVAISGALSGSLLDGGLTATAIAVGSIIAGRRALASRDRDPLITRLCLAVAVRGGTRFRGADLSDATFASARLHSADFRGAVLEGACFEGAEIRHCLFDRNGGLSNGR